MTHGDPEVKRSQVLGYCLFDFANSSYTTLISTVAYSVYFRQVVAGASGRADLLWSLAQVGAQALLILGAPILGALADFSGRKRRYLALTAVQTVVACAALALVGPGDVVLGMAILIVGSVGFEGGYVFYNACLADVSTPRTIGRVSGLSWGVGFLGGLLALVTAAPWISRPLRDASGLVPQAVHDYRVSFVVVAAFFAAFALPALALLPERGPRRALPSLATYARVGFGRVRDTVRELGRYRDAALFVFSALCFYGGIETVIKFSAIYAAVSFGIEGRDLVLLFVVTNLVAAPGTLLAGVAADRFGARRTLAATLVLWVVLDLVAAFVTTASAFWFVACGMAVGMGSTQAVARSFLAQIAPPERVSEFFGFYVLCSKIGSIAALLVFGIASFWASQRAAVLGVLPFFLAGLVLLLAVDERRAHRVAQANSPAA
jgi:MFS transporter, UMF1 family